MSRTEEIIAVAEALARAWEEYFGLLQGRTVVLRNDGAVVCEPTGDLASAQARYRALLKRLKQVEWMPERYPS